MAVTYYLHQVGIFRGTRTPMQFAREVVDPMLGTSFAGFMNIYLKQKYAQQPLTPAEQQQVNTFLKPFMATARKKLKFSKRLGGFLNPSRSVSFFVKPDDEEE